MGLFDGCLLASDIDGTLLANGNVARRTVDRVKWFVSEGGTFALSTGRSVGAVSMVLERLPGLIGPSVVANGCMIYDYSAQKILYEKVLPEEDHSIIRMIYEKFPEIGIELHSGERVLVPRRNQEILVHEVYEKLDSELVTLEEAEKYSWTKGLLASDEPDGLEPVKQFVSTLEPKGSHFINTIAVIGGRNRHYYEHIPMGTSKATALEKLHEFVDIKKGCCFAIGDYYNDLEMIKWADIGAVTSEAPEDLKQQADFIAGTAEEGAVADFIEYLSKIVSEDTGNK